jgi:hypothetical protein
MVARKPQGTRSPPDFEGNSGSSARKSIVQKKLTSKKLIGMGAIVLIAVLAMLWLQSKLNSIMGLM